MPTDDEIRKLCARVLKQAEDVETYEAALSELRAAICKHFAKMETGGIHLVRKTSKVRETVKTTKARKSAKNGTTG